MATYRVVGEDEIDLHRGDISWKSPLGRALLSKREGDSFVLKRPSGDLEVSILNVRYRPASIEPPCGAGATGPSTVPEA